MTPTHRILEHGMAHEPENFVFRHHTFAKFSVDTSIISCTCNAFWNNNLTFSVHESAIGVPYTGITYNSKMLPGKLIARH
jgi:hypothetical protein